MLQQLIVFIFNIYPAFRLNALDDSFKERRKRNLKFCGILYNIIKRRTEYDVY